MPKKEVALKNSTYLFIFIMTVWGMYRLLFKYSEGTDELVVKPLLWLVPVLYLTKKEKLGLSSLGITGKKLFPAIYLSIALGAGFAIEGVIVNLVKYKGIPDYSANIGTNPFFASLLITFVTAVTEEVTFRGYIFNRYLYAFKNEWLANVTTSLYWALVHLPITIFRWKLSPSGILGYFILTFAYGVGASFLFAKTKNVASPILLHLFWEWPIILFR